MRWILPILICLPLAARGGEWHVDKKATDNEVKFTSRVTAFTFSGVTDQIDGFVYWEGDSLFARKPRFHFEVNLSGFDTGIGKRDRDMREVLDTEKWPRAVYKGEITEHAAVDSTAAAYRVSTKGTLSLHGIDRAIEVPGTVVVEEGRSRIEAAFTLKLDDYEIEAPSLAVFVKVSQEIALEVSVYLKHLAPAQDLPETEGAEP